MTFDKVKEILVDTISADEDKITLEASLVDDLGADSLDAVEICMAMEEAFGISIPDEVATTFATVKDIVDYVDQAKA